MDKELYELAKELSGNIKNFSPKESPFKTLLIAIVSGIGVYYVPRLFKWLKNYRKPILVYHFAGSTYIELERIKHSFGRQVNDKDASNGKAWQHTSDQINGGATTCYGPYTKEIPFRGKYKARFRIKVCGIKEKDATIMTLDVAYGEPNEAGTFVQLGIPLVEKHLRGVDFVDGKYKNFDVKFEYDGQSLIEFRCSVVMPTNFTVNVDQIFFDNIKVFLVSEII